MQRTRAGIRNVVLLLVSALAAACGGGSSGGGGSPSQPNQPGQPPPTGGTPPPPSGTDITTYKYDLARTGQNLTETSLTTANVKSSSFGLLRLLTVDGKVDAQPLYLSGLSLQGGTHNVVFVATENDSVYAFDADSGTALWKASLLKSGESPTEPVDGCNQIAPQIGITATPVIDRSAGAHGTLYVVAMSKDGSANYYQRLHALDVTTGAELLGGPVVISASFPGRHDELRRAPVRGARSAAAYERHPVHELYLPLRFTAVFRLGHRL